VKVENQFIALGGRRIQPVDIFHPHQKKWTTGQAPPLELHPFQALEHQGKVLIAGAMTGRFPAEVGVAHLYYYDPKKDRWEKGPPIPKDRQRGSAGAFIKDDKLYLVCGITNGHRAGWVTWFDEYDFETKSWRKLPEAPHARDHFQATVIGDLLVLAGGRRSGEGGKVFAPVVSEVDVFDFKIGKWRTLDEPFPVPRAGTSSLALGNEVLVIGGESKRPEAHTEVHALDVSTWKWRELPSLPRGLHGTQPLWHEGTIYLQAGSVTRGGTETEEMTRFRITP
jgi:N-acetylneuraminic acid mutarotase